MSVPMTTTKSAPKYTVGQKLLYVPYDERRSAPFEVTVTKVARKWIDLDKYRMRMDEDGNIDGRGYSSPGKCWPSREEYERYALLCEKWRSFHYDMEHRWQPPPDVTPVDIAKARELLRIPERAP